MRFLRVYVMALFVALMAMLGSCRAVAGTVTGPVTAELTLPTTRMDNSPLLAADIAKCTIKWGLVSGTYPNAIDVPCSAPSATWSVTLTGAAKTVASVYVIGVVRDTDGGVGTSPEGKKSFDVPAPAVPAAPGLSVR